MTLASVVGQPRAIDALQAAIRGNSVHHAYLFAGPEGVGKELAAVGLAQALLCEAKRDEGCGTCSTCTRIARNLHPDVTWVLPDAERVSRGFAGRSDIQGVPSREIRIDAIRALQERLSLHGLESRRKIAIVLSAETLNRMAQNAFLKTLEEPPSDTTLVLVASSPDALLPTLRSRCSFIHFGPLPEAYLAERLQKERKLTREDARLVAVMAGGSIGRALALDVNALADRQELIRGFEALHAGGVGPLLRFAERHGASREEAEQSLAILQLWNRDVALASAGAANLANQDLASLAVEVAARVSRTWLHRRHELLGHAQYLIGERNGAPRLQLERMLIDMWERA